MLKAFNQVTQEVKAGVEIELIPRRWIFLFFIVGFQSLSTDAVLATAS